MVCPVCSCEIKIKPVENVLAIGNAANVLRHARVPLPDLLPGDRLGEVAMMAGVVPPMAHFFPIG
jgi:hypothetical protein